MLAARFTEITVFAVICYYFNCLTNYTTSVFQHLVKKLGSMYDSVNFYCATRMHSADYAVARCVCPSVSLSVTRRYSV